jgi:hypothetical protein
MRSRAMHTTAWRMHVVRDHVPCGHVEHRQAFIDSFTRRVLHTCKNMTP